MLGTTSKLIAKVSPDNIKNKRIYFASNNKEVATVNECGEITAHSLGTADITATSENGNITATCKIIVVKTLDQTDESARKGTRKGTNWSNNKWKLLIIVITSLIYHKDIKQITAKKKI